tara:strand:+ start:2931 stop:3365 length:435 start_codon:yes stop_codon:yes gene_type:complete
MAKGSNLSTVCWTDVAEGGSIPEADYTAELRSISISGDGRGFIDSTTLGDGYVSNIVGQQQQVTISIVTLDEPGNWARPSLGDQTGKKLILFMGDSPDEGTENTQFQRTYHNTIITDCSMSVGVDAVIEINWTFVTIADPTSST